ncbi:MAG: DUF502 domain-containing protein [Gammaproteobacteria bacterium]|nr:DUF502 domain-containing protein [Gammaproteobacteria bacterium]
MAKIRKYFITGLLIWAPILATIWIIDFLIRLLDSSLRLLPQTYQPEEILGFSLPGAGVIFSLAVLLLTGLLTTNFLGRHLVKLWDKLIGRIPLVRTIYAGIKQTMETLFKSNSQAFRRVLLVEYPRKGLWSIAFQTSDNCHHIDEQTGEKMLAIFVPTTPNPTSGFLIFVPENHTRELNINVDAALKMVISLGVIQPPDGKAAKQQTELPQS